MVLAVKKNTDHLAVQLRLMLHLNTNPGNNVVDCSYSITHPRKFKTKKIFQSDILTLKPFTNFCFAMLFGNITFIQIFKLKTMKATPQLLKYVFTWAKLFRRLDVLTEFLPQKIKKKVESLQSMSCCKRGARVSMFSPLNIFLHSLH